MSGLIHVLHCVAQPNVLGMLSHIRGSSHHLIYKIIPTFCIGLIQVENSYIFQANARH